MPSWPALRGKVLAFRRREGVPCSSRSSKSEILAKGRPDFFDVGFPAEQQLPRLFRVRIEDDSPQVGKVKLTAIINGAERPFGNPLTDNSYDPDSYRFHDVFHLGFAACLGWSPVTRKNLGCKRKAIPKIETATTTSHS